MKNPLSAWAGVALWATAAVACTREPPATTPEVPAVLIGAMAPRVAFDATYGAREHVTMEALKGSVVLVDFWDTGCEPCARELPKVEQLYERYAAAGFRVIAVSQDEPDAVDEIPRFVERYGLTFPVVWDEGHRLKERFGPGDMPSAYVIDRRGVVRFEHIGYVKGEELELEREIQKLVAEKD